MAESSAIPHLQGLEIEAVEWLPSGADSGLVRVRGRWSAGAAAQPGLPELLLRADGADHRFESLPDARFARDPASWRGSYLVPGALVAGDPEALWVEWPGGARCGLPPLARGLASPAAAAAAEPEPEEPGGQLIDRAVLAERRARRAETAEREQARVAAEALKAVEALELQSAELERRLAEAVAERDALAGAGPPAGGARAASARPASAPAEPGPDAPGESPEAAAADAPRDEVRQAPVEAASPDAGGAPRDAVRQELAEAALADAGGAPRHAVRQEPAGAASPDDGGAPRHAVRQEPAEAAFADAGGAPRDAVRQTPARTASSGAGAPSPSAAELARLAERRQAALAGALDSLARLRAQSREWRLALRAGETARSGDAVRLAVLEAERALGDASVRGALKARTRELAEQAERAGALEAVRAELEAALAQARGEAAEARDALERAREAADARLAAAIAAAEATREQLELRRRGEHAVHEEVRAELRERLAAAESRANALEAAQAELAADRDDAAARAASLGARIAELETALAVAETGLATAEATAANAEARLRVESVARAALETELDRAREGGDAAALAAALEAERAARAAERDARAVAADGSALADDLAAALEAEREARHAAETALADARGARAALEAELAGTREARAAAEAGLAAAHAELAAARAEFEAEAVAARGELEAELEAELAAARGELEAALAAEREARASAEAALAEAREAADRHGRTLQDRIAELERGAAGLADEVRLAEAARAQAEAAAAAAAPPPEESGRLLADLDAAAAKLRDAAQPAEPADEAAAPAEPTEKVAGGAEPADGVAAPAEPTEKVAGGAEPTDGVAAPAEPAAEVAAPAEPAAEIAAPAEAPAERVRPRIVSASKPPSRGDAIGRSAREYPRLRGAIVKLAHDDAAAAGRLLAALLPAQAAALATPLDYDLTIAEAGTFAVTIDGPVARVHARPQPRGRGHAEFHVSSDALTLAELLAGVDHRIGRWRGPARFSGSRRKLDVLRALPATAISLADAARAGAELEPSLVYRTLAYAVHPSWTRGERFTLAQEITGERPETWYLSARDGAGMTVSDEPPAEGIEATVSMTRATFARMLRDEPVPSGERPAVRGDHRAVALVKAWMDRAGGGA